MKVIHGGAVSMKLRKLLFLVAKDNKEDGFTRLRALQIASLIPHQGRGMSKAKRWT